MGESGTDRSEDEWTAGGPPLAVRVVHRYCEKPSAKPRPPWFSKEDCLVTLLEALEGVERSEIHFVVDGPISPAAERLMGGGTIHRPRSTGNAQSVLAAVEVALREPVPELVLLTEDDHLWHPEAVHAMLAAVRSIPEADYLTGYNCPDLWTRPEHLRFASYGFGAVEDHVGWRWRPIRSTVMTFGARPHALREDAWLIRMQCVGAHPNDDLIFAALQGTGRRRWAALHLLRSRTSTRRTLRLLRFLAGRPMPRLWCCEQSLAAHAEVGWIPDDFELGGRGGT